MYDNFVYLLQDIKCDFSYSYDMIRYIYVRSKASAWHRHNRFRKNKNQLAHKKRCRQKSVKAVREEEENYGGRICETDRF